MNIVAYQVDCSCGRRSTRCAAGTLARWGSDNTCWRAVRTR